MDKTTTVRRCNWRTGQKQFSVQIAQVMQWDGSSYQSGGSLITTQAINVQRPTYYLPDKLEGLITIPYSNLDRFAVLQPTNEIKELARHPQLHKYIQVLTALAGSMLHGAQRSRMTLRRVLDDDTKIRHTIPTNILQAGLIMLQRQGAKFAPNFPCIYFFESTLIYLHAAVPLTTLQLLYLAMCLLRYFLGCGGDT